MSIAILGAGAFGTALAVTLSRQTPVILWARDAEQAQRMQSGRENRRLPGVTLPENVTVTAEMADISAAEVVLLGVPMQQLAGFLAQHTAQLDGKILVACCKGIDLATGNGPSALIADACPAAVPAVLTGPSFAADIARGLPTALTLACADPEVGPRLQSLLSTPVLRLYLSTDLRGAELGGALKNVVAIAAGVVMGAGLGDSARAALMTRGFAEMMRAATLWGAQAETLSGLSGLGDLVLTCGSDQSRNFRYGHALGAGQAFDTTTTVEGAATARALVPLIARHGLDLPVSQMVAALVDGKITVENAVTALLARPLKQE
ncbi:NAD(P)H-dependent glycerol-3-phosphate dehydrogenase [Phaeovulum sp. W22_SRMD_FR3]|uniref:NAD(P)H-dependent glycerol-3-phosphate dehydrogenase n=1 Tax=Phaeovulum sp. W22_SRMD_FR3 TaxID=3240274 RepID=UPI003F9D364D